MRIRMEFEKDGSVSFVSHLELMKVFAQSARRAHLPVASTEGFNPRPKWTFSSAVATGMASFAECADLELTEEMDPQVVQARLNQTLPPGFHIHRARRLAGKTRSLMAQNSHAGYRVRLRFADGVSVPGSVQMDADITSFLAQPEIPVRVERKGKIRDKDLRPGILSMKTADGDPSVFELLLKAGSEGNVRPEHVMQAFIAFCDLKNVCAMRLEKTMTYGTDSSGRRVPLFELQE